jgi:hypothetical protein
MESKFGKFLSEAGKTAKEQLDRAVTAATYFADQNSDGEFSLDDAAVKIENAKGTIIDGAQKLADAAGEKAKELELKRLAPISREEASSVELSKFIRITERTKSYQDNELCPDAVGNYTYEGDFRMVTIFADSLNLFNLSFYPDSNSEFYWVDPTDRNRYIALDQYFDYLKQEEIAELQRIAQSLGATYFKVTYREMKKTLVSRETQIKLKPIVDASKETTSSESAASTILAEMHFEGREPVMPELKYLKNDPNIKNLIALRMDSSSPLKNQTYSLNLSNTSGLKERDAMKIDSILKKFNMNGNVTVVHEVQSEARKILDYQVNFE